MTTALAQRHDEGAPPRGSVLHRLGQLRHTSPGRLQLLLTILLTLGVLTGLVAGLTAGAASTGTDDLRDRGQPLLVEAETIYTALADADTTAAQAFLAGGQEPVQLTQRYEADLARASTALTSAARRTPADSKAAAAVEALAAGTARYASLVATARAVNRQGLPVGAAYLSTASQLNRETLQPQARTLLQFAGLEVREGYQQARGSWWLTLLLTLLVALTVALMATQLHLSRATRRTFNVPLVAATVLTAVLAAGSATVFSAQRDRLDLAATEGSEPVAALTDIRILVLRERADEALTLAARSGSGPLETDFQAIRERLTFDDPALDDVYPLMQRARVQHDRYAAIHQQVRDSDDGGDYDAAVELAVGPAATTAFDELTDTVDTALEDRRTVFEEHIGAAGRGLGTLTVLGPLLALAVALLAATGLRARLQEYR